MKAVNPLGRGNPNTGKAEVKKLAGQAKDKTEPRPVQEKTKDATHDTDRTTDGKEVHDKAKEQSKQVHQTESFKDTSGHGRDRVMNADQDSKGNVKDVVSPINNMNGEVQVKDPIVNGTQVKDPMPTTDRKDAEVKKDEKTRIVNNNTVTYDAGAKDKTNDKRNDPHSDTGRVNDAVSGDSKEVKDKPKEGQKQSEVSRTTSQQKNIKAEKTNEERKAGARETAGKVSDSNDIKLNGSAAENETMKKATIPLDNDDDDDDDDDEEERQTESERDIANSRHRNLNGHTHNRTRTRHKRNGTQRKYEEELDDSDDTDSGDQLAMDNALVRHLLPHMSPALLPKSMKPKNRARDSSATSSEDDHPPLTPRTSLLNVIREHSEHEDTNENGDKEEDEESNEESDEESDEEIQQEPIKPHPSMATLRRHSFHHFPAPPTRSQSKNAMKVRALLQAVEEEELNKISKKLGEKTELVRHHLGHVENRLFEMFGDNEKKTININKFLMGLTAAGMRPSDPRLKQTRENLKKLQDQLGSEFVSLDIEYETFMGIISENLEIIIRAFSASFVIPDFQGFCKQVEEIYNTCYTNHSGTPAQYIPQLARFDSKPWGVSVCTVDGQRFSLGDVEVPFTIQSCSKPLTYAIGLAVNGTDYMHKYVGMEPSGRYFNELVLDYCNKPHNPMINSGAIMTAAIIKPELSAADRFDYMFNVYKRLAGDEHLGFNNSVFLSERECADRNFALAYFMRENKCFPDNHKLHESLDFYFQLCSLEITAESGAVIAATLANGGLNPLTGDPVLTVDAVRNTLTLMHSCGMYNYSGQFAFHVGLPAKSGVSGCVLLVIPNTMGICLWSPPLDSNGNSCRGVQFCMEMVSRFNFHNFDNLRGFTKSKQDPRTAKTESKAQVLFDLLFSAAAGDMSALRRHSLAGTDMQAKDYDGRTALHVATSEGHDEIVEFLLNNCNVDPLPRDRWDRTPLDDAESFDRPKCAKMISECCKRKGIKPPMSYKAYMALSNQSNGPIPINSS